nr:methionine synthase [uncultured Oscillibacter sp.]
MTLESGLVEEALRYLGAAEAPEALRRQAAGEMEALRAQVRPRYVYRVWDLDFRGDGIALRGTGLVLRGTGAARMLETCDQAALLACTLGARFDLSLTALQARDMARAVIVDACGSALVEQGCGEAEAELSARFPGRYLTDRFSPGYGDLPLELQGDICAVLDAARRLGLTVTESLLLNPVKSVTAVIGLSDRPQMARIRGCACCQMRECCALRKGGKHCGS